MTDGSAKYTAALSEGTVTVTIRTGTVFAPDDQHLRVAHARLQAAVSAGEWFKHFGFGKTGRISIDFAGDDQLAVRTAEHTLKRKLAEAGSTVAP